MTLTEPDINEIGRIVEEKIEEKFNSSPKINKIIKTLDIIVGQLNAMQEEKDVLTHQVSDHEDRITSL